MQKIGVVVEIYKCIVLTVIAAALVMILFRTPVPYTYQNVRDGVVEKTQIPLVRVYGGRVTADIDQ